MDLATFIFGAVNLALLIQLYADKYQRDDLDKTLEELEEDLSLPRIKTYDFIVVGGGSAGCLMAGRLSEHFSVLLLEMGGDPPPPVSNTYFVQPISNHPAINSIFLAQPQSIVSQETGVNYPSGKMLGGSGSHNVMIWNRGSPHDYDNIATLTGDESWSYAKMLPHFKTLEEFNSRLVNESQRHDFFSKTGALHVETQWPPINEAWFEAGKELGYPANDPNGFQTESFAPAVKNVENSERVNSFTTFVKPFLKSRSSLTVLRYSNATQILVDAHNRAYGVAYSRHGIPQIAHASKEVIVSCGTFQSPLLLIKSGIGPRTTLEAAQIPIKNALEGVGQNFKANLDVSLVFTVTQPNTTLLPIIGPDQIEHEINKYQNSHKRSGYLTQMAVGPQAFLVSTRAKREGEGHWPDFQLSFVQPLLFNTSQAQGLQIGLFLTRRKSLSEIGFDSEAYLAGETDDTRLAVWTVNTLQTDIDTLVEGIPIVLKIMEETSTFRKMGVEYTDTIPAACAALHFRSTEYWKCFIQQRAFPGGHPVGTCKMEKGNDPLDVVDPKLRVHGIKNLRVVDASVLPTTVNANSQGAVMVVAEKIAKEIIAEHGKK